MKHSNIRKFFAAAALACLCLPVLQSCGGDDPARRLGLHKGCPAGHPSGTHTEKVRIAQIIYSKETRS